MLRGDVTTIILDVVVVVVVVGMVVAADESFHHILKHPSSSPFLQFLRLESCEQNYF